MSLELSTDHFRNGERSFALSLLVFTAFLAIFSMKVPGAKGERAEVVLWEVLSKPFAPSDYWVSAKCLRDSGIYLRELARYTPWALKMYDASAKIPPGIITGNYKQLGNYDECLSVKSSSGFVGQACSAGIQFEITADNKSPANSQPDLADLLLNVAKAANATEWDGGNTVVYEWLWCVPSSCNHTEVQEALEIALDPLKVDGRVDLIINVPKESCRTYKTDELVFETVDWIYISILAIFVLIIIVSTSYDIAKQGRLRTLNRKDTTYVLLTSFSVYSNGKTLLKTERHRDSLGCLDGLRYLSICWIIYGHTHYNEVIGVKMNLTHIPFMHLDWSTMLVLNGNIVTDTFFLLSGILLAYTELTKKQRDSNWRFDPIGLYVHRYLRLTPAYAMMIGFYATLFYKFGSGPHWEKWVGSNRDYCRENWWTNLLYVNNYVNLPSMCMSQSWYLATDMQLVWLSPIFLYPMLKFSRSFPFWLVSSLALFLSVFAPFLVTYSQNLTGTMLYYKDQEMVSKVYTQIYTRVYNRFGPYVIGLILGYLLYKSRSRAVKIPIPYVVCGWLIAIVAGLLAVFGSRGMYFDSHSYNRLEASFYAALHRHVFVLAISWIIFSSVHGYAGIVGEFLSWRGWIPFSRLTYSAYLSHYVLLLHDSGSVRTTTILTPLSIVRTFFANLFLTMILSALWSLCFEIPFMTIERVLMSRWRCFTLHFGRSKEKKNFGSTDSAKEIYRRTDESTSTLSQAYNEDSNRSNCSNNTDSSCSSNTDSSTCPHDSLQRTNEKKSRQIFVIGADLPDNCQAKVSNQLTSHPSSNVTHPVDQDYIIRT